MNLNKFRPNSEHWNVCVCVCVYVYHTIKRLLQLDPVLVDEVAVVLSMPEACVAL